MPPHPRRQSSNMPLQQSHRISLHRDSAEELMIRGNKHLSNGSAEEAIKSYSKILYKISPGHVPAFLNRSLAYLSLQFPELAVTDLYRAGISIQGMRANSSTGNERGQAACYYLRAERLDSDSGAEWTSAQRRFIGPGWAASPLASIVLSDVPEVGMAIFSHAAKSKVCNALELRAVYRLCGALYMCGEGARLETLGLIDDALRKYKSMEPWEKDCFKVLGNEIMSEIVAEKKNIRDPQGLGALFNNPHNLQHNLQQDGKKTYAENMKLRTASIKLEGYPWNTWEPELLKRDWQLLLKEWVSGYTSNCTPRVMGYLDVYDGQSKPYIELAASREIQTGELLVTEQTRSNVTTSIPEEIHEHFTQHCEEAHYYCDSCATKLVVPGISPICYKGSSVPLPSPEPWETSGDSSPGDTRASRDSDSDKMDSSPIPEFADSPVPELASVDPDLISQSPAPLSSQAPDNPTRPTAVSAPPSPLSHVLTPSLPDIKPPPDFMFCCETHKVPSCCNACFNLRETFDRGLCHTSIEKGLRISHLRDRGVKSTTDRKTQCLRDLLMMRIFTQAFNTNTHPLHIDDIAFATCGPNRETSNHNMQADPTDLDKGEPKSQPWSFNDNVIRPIHYLQQYFNAAKMDAFVQLEATDGWVLNTLMSKIGTAMKITHGPRYLKLYDNDGFLDHATSNINISWSAHIDGRPRNEEADEDWVASITPTFNMIRIANESRWEVPNCKVIQKEGLFVYAVCDINAGQALLRAADGPNGPGLGEGMYGEGGDGGLEDGLGGMDLAGEGDHDVESAVWGDQWDV